MKENTVFEGDDLRRTDPKFVKPRFAQYLAAVARLDRLAQRFGKRVIHLAVRWMLDNSSATFDPGRRLRESFLFWSPKARQWDP